MQQVCLARLGAVLGLVAIALPARAQAAPDSWLISGELARSCTIAYSCGGNDRCNQLRLDDRITPQDIAQISVTCNFTAGNAALELSSQNNGSLQEPRDPAPLTYSLSLVGTGSSDFADRLLTVPLRIALRPQTAGQAVVGMLRLRLDSRQSTLVAGRYSDRITVTVLPEQ